MQVTNFRLKNLGRFEDLTIELAPNENASSKVTVLVGNNGAGKTTILKSLATSLSWFVARIKSEKGNGSAIPEEVILNGAVSAATFVSVFDASAQPHPAPSNLYRWTLAKTRKGRKPEYTSVMTGVSKLTDFYRTALTDKESASLPLIAFYPVERAIVKIILKVKERHTFLQLDGYDGSLNQGVDFQRFFEWFREREDAENETGISQELLDKLWKTLGSDKDIWPQLTQLSASSRDRQLTAVRTAIANFMPGFDNLKVRRKPRLHMSIDKGGKSFDVMQLSQGEKSLMALVGDIARRLAMMNPALDNPLQGEGIVLIDEVDMHLHPSWQRKIVNRLTDTFPNCQFVLTTHSPLVISDCKDILVYSLDNGVLEQVPSQYGQDANTVLLDVMDTDIRNATVTKRLNDFMDLIQDRKLEEAKAELNELELELPANNMELSKAKLLLRKEELRHEKNQ